MATKLQTTFEDLYNNCLYSSIAHTISNLKNPFFAYTQSWDGINYSFHYGSSRGTITFDLHNKVLVGAIRDDKSSRRNWYPKYKAIELFDKAPEIAKSLSDNEALQYLFDEVDGITLPVATTAFWNIDDQIICYDNLDDFINNGGEFIYVIIVPIRELQIYWKEQYELTSEELKLVDHLFQLKKSGKMKISMNDFSIVEKHSEGYKSFIESLTEIGFEVT